MPQEVPRPVESSQGNHGGADGAGASRLQGSLSGRTSKVTSLSLSPGPAEGSPRCRGTGRAERSAPRRWV